MDTERKCPSCGKPLPPSAPKGLCPECLMKAGFGTGVAPEPGQPSRTPSFVPPPVAEVAKLFPQFEILELLGQGGMGAVYKARQPSLDRLVALKILPPESGSDTGFADRFTREARALARLSHPNIVAVHEFGQAGGLHYFVMEYVEGLNLRQLEQAGKLAPREALKIIPQICDALQFAHDEGIVHRDIKPENVMLDKKGRVKITDFGLAKILRLEPEALRLTGAKDVMGTPHYMAPEQVERPQEVDHRADIYSLGVVFYEMLTGELPLGKFQPPSRKVQVDVRLDEVVLHALEKEPERRYQQASQVKTDVETIAATPPGSSRRQEAQTGKPVDNQSLLTSAATRQEPRFSRTALWGAVWAPLALLLLLMAQWIESYPPPLPDWLQEGLFAILLALGLTAVLGTTILGGIAISQIRRSRGRLYGLGLAVFDALLYPMLALNGSIPGLLNLAANELTDAFIPYLGRELFTLLKVTVLGASCVAANWLIIRAVWRAANRPPGGGQSAGEAAGPGGRARPASGSRSLFFSGPAWYVGILVGLVLLAGSIVWGIWERRPSVSPETVVRVEAKLRQEVEKHLNEAGWTMDGLSVNVSPNLKQAQCRFGTAWKNGLSEIPFNGAIHVTPQGNNLWLIAGAGQFQFLRFSVDTTAQMSSLPAAFEYSEPEGVNPATSLALKAPRFGPVREVTLNDVEEGRGGDALDLDSGQLLDVPKDVRKLPRAERYKWLAARSVDLVVTKAEGLWGLGTTTANQLKLALVGNESWNAITEQSLSNTLAARSAGLEMKELPYMRACIPASDAQPPVTFAFRTASGTTGLLQITGFTERPNSVRLRYKLVQSRTEPVRASPSRLGDVPAPDPEHDFVAQHRADLGQKALDAARDFVYEHQWKMQSEWGNNQGRVVFKATDGDGKRITFEEANQGDGMARFTISTDPGAELPARRIGAAIWWRLGWRNPYAASSDYQTTPLSFGPEKEVTLTEFNNMDGQEALDLDSGVVHKQPKDMDQWSEAGLIQWVRQNGIDLFVDHGPGGRWGLLTTLPAELRLGRVTNEKWSNIDLVELLAALTNSPPPLEVTERGSLKVVMLPKEAQPPPTFAFKTSKGNLGLLQITGFTEKPRGVKLRYKLVSSASNLATTTAAAPEARPVPFAQAKPGEFKVPLTNGMGFEVVAIASSPRSSEVWWRPDGTLLPEAPGDRLTDISALCPSPKSRAEFAILTGSKSKSLPEGDLVLAFDPQPQSVAAANLYKNNSLVPVTLVGFGAAPNSLTCRIGLANGPWERVATWDQTGTLLNNESHAKLEFRRSHADNETCLKLVAGEVDLDHFGLRLTARLKDGRYKNAQTCTATYGSPHRILICALIKGLSDSDVITYELYTAPLRWADIPGIATKPNVPPIQGDPTGSSGRTSQIEDLPEADRARVVALFNDIEDFGHEFNAAFTARNLAAARTGTRRLLTLLSNFNAVVRGTGYEFPAALLTDVGKVRAALDEGDWDKVKQAARFNEEYAREFKRIGSRMAELAQQPKGSAAAFGPVIERVIPGKGDTNKRFIDLDTGRQFAAAEFFGPKAEPSPAATEEWLKQTGIDAVGDTRIQYDGLVGFGMVAAPVPSEEWDRLSPSGLAYYLAATAPGTPATMSGKGKLPATFAIKTRGGARGLLQILSVTNSPPSIRIRYKLAQDTGDDLKGGPVPVNGTLRDAGKPASAKLVQPDPVRR